MSSIRLPDPCDNTEDRDRDVFLDRVDMGEICPQCYGRSISVALDMLDRIMFHCDTCKHEWESKNGNQNQG